MGSFMKKAREEEWQELRSPDKKERLVLRVEQWLMQRTSMPLVFRSFLQAFLKTGGSYLEHILPERNEKDNLPAGHGDCGQRDRINRLCWFLVSPRRRVCWDWLCPPRTIGVGIMRSSACFDWSEKELGLHKVQLSCFGYNIQSQRVMKLSFYPRLA